MEPPETLSPAMAALKPQHRKFLREWLVLRHGEKAALAAGYAERSARSTASTILAREDVRAAIAEAEGRLQEIHEDELERILDELRRIAFGGLGDFLRITPDGDPYIDLSRASREDLNTLDSTEIEDYVEGRGENARNVRRVKIKRADRLKALELLGKHFGLGNRREEEAVDRLTQAVREIAQRGSAMPIGQGRKA